MPIGWFAFWQPLINDDDDDGDDDDDDDDDDKTCVLSRDFLFLLILHTCVSELLICICIYFAITYIRLRWKWNGAYYLSIRYENLCGSPTTINHLYC